MLLEVSLLHLMRRDHLIWLLSGSSPSLEEFGGYMLELHNCLIILLLLDLSHQVVNLLFSLEEKCILTTLC